MSESEVFELKLEMQHLQEKLTFLAGGTNGAELVAVVMEKDAELEQIVSANVKCKRREKSMGLSPPTLGVSGHTDKVPFVILYKTAGMSLRGSQVSTSRPWIPWPSVGQQQYHHNRSSGVVATLLAYRDGTQCAYLI